MSEAKNPEHDNSKRIIQFRHHAYLLQFYYKQSAIATKLGFDRSNFNSYYNGDKTPGIDFLDKFDQVFGPEIRLLIEYLKNFNKEDIIISEGNFHNRYAQPGYQEEYTQALKDHNETLKADVTSYRGQIDFLQYIIRTINQERGTENSNEKPDTE